MGRKVVSESRGEMDLDIAGLLIGHGVEKRQGEEHGGSLRGFEPHDGQFCSCSCMTAL